MTTSPKIELAELKLACEQLTVCYPHISIEHWAASFALQAQLGVILEQDHGIWIAKGHGVEEDLDTAGDFPMEALIRWDAAYSHLREKQPDYAV